MRRAVWILGLTFAVIAAAMPVWAAAPDPNHPPTVTLELTPTSQGPIWPPGEVVDEDGNYPVVGSILTEVSPGVVVPVFGAAVVSKDTVPPLDENGREDFTNIFGAPFQVIRPLDLSPGSPDLDIVLYSNSFGPPSGDFGGGPRVPMQGDSLYNLGSLPAPCPEIFPAAGQEDYRRPSVPLHEVPIMGFQGDGTALDVHSGTPYVPSLAAGAYCGSTACPGENDVDVHPRAGKPITLGEWLGGKVQARITLKNFDADLGTYTHAEFKFTMRGALPNALYTTWMGRRHALYQGTPAYRLPDPVGIPNVLFTDENGNADATYLVRNPFPDPTKDAADLGVVGLAMAYHSDYQNWGTCVARVAVGVEVHVNYQYFGPLNFVTAEPGG